MKIAIVCDWLVTVGGAEKVLHHLIKCFPDADLFSVINFLKEDDQYIIHGKEVKVSFVQKLPRAKISYRNYINLMTIAVEQFDLKGYDLIISSSHAVAKGVITSASQIHICYCHSPMRYAWDLQNQYLDESGLSNGIKSVVVRYLLHKLRIWDVISSNRVDHFIANSSFIAKRIKKVYNRHADVINPPVDTFESAIIYDKSDREDYYVTASRLVPYKKVDLIVEAFLQMPDKKLLVIGGGPLLKVLKSKIAKKQHGREQNILIVGYQPDEYLKDKMSKAKGFVFAAEEDFGILPVEAQALGTPVIAYGQGGVLETVLNYDDYKNESTGVMFFEQTTEAIIKAINYFEQVSDSINVESCQQNAKKFAVEVFHKKIIDFVEKVTVAKFKVNNLADKDVECKKAP